ncbi:hypothetical protein, unlikely [Trypanosoma brucei gambiense DAL972]|uniref:Uncharacterized protein n=1 Tax=Trypanosoma brucei gambiense (strain MHOM/CI/86/DAL972) TaxID=679716 RepID=D0A286_TRYB9|nr:hypothetical protein, unlikely [Trypanosoma brucei gambiense DAL972]CBH15380.1 hypothetical protein, unlikely [Trypanosoma brucei gambiense DAL972]|eukprot:XP_011777644.1 hypothetical protein, unlikely [Trypanosoma brucei gambiense DAL972]
MKNNPQVAKEEQTKGVNKTPSSSNKANTLQLRCHPTHKAKVDRSAPHQHQQWKGCKPSTTTTTTTTKQRTKKLKLEFFFSPNRLLPHQTYQNECANPVTYH